MLYLEQLSVWCEAKVLDFLKKEEEEELRYEKEQAEKLMRMLASGNTIENRTGPGKSNTVSH